MGDSCAIQEGFSTDNACRARIDDRLRVAQRAGKWVGRKLIRVATRRLLPPLYRIFDGSTAFCSGTRENVADALLWEENDASGNVAEGDGAGGARRAYSREVLCGASAAHREASSGDKERKRKMATCLVSHAVSHSSHHVMHLPVWVSPFWYPPQLRHLRGSCWRKSRSKKQMSIECFGVMLRKPKYSTWSCCTASRMAINCPLYTTPEETEKCRRDSETGKYHSRSLLANSIVYALNATGPQFVTEIQRACSETGHAYLDSVTVMWKRSDVVPAAQFKAETDNISTLAIHLTRS
ncbi:hypothetical protein F5888DRAFT_1635443 [Russula emetica]|nr:hypothetical protein F5888DRAFT_1635443 [Russula emetica]